LACSLTACGGDSTTTPVAPSEPQVDDIPSGTNIVINEFRTRGPNGEYDEFIELRNDSNGAIDIGGWQLAASDDAGTTTNLRTIGARLGTSGIHSSEVGFTISPGCHYLLTNYNGYRGESDNTYNPGIPDNGGITLKNSSGVTIDSVGLSNGSAFKEGTPLAAFPDTNIDQSYKRTGNDTNNNAGDFVLSSPSTELTRLTTCLIR